MLIKNDCYGIWSAVSFVSSISSVDFFFFFKFLHVIIVIEGKELITAALAFHPDLIKRTPDEQRAKDSVEVRQLSQRHTN